MSSTLRAFALVILVSACGSKGSDLQKIRADGYGCSRTGGGAGFVPTPGQHCFVCADDKSMAACGENPLTSGCHEEDCAAKPGSGGSGH
jgi:hypothetical protein